MLLKAILVSMCICNSDLHWKIKKKKKEPISCYFLLFSLGISKIKCDIHF